VVIAGEPFSSTTIPPARNEELIIFIGRRHFRGFFMLFFFLLLLQIKPENKDMTWIVLVQLCGLIRPKETKSFCRRPEGYMYFNTTAQAVTILFQVTRN
jgi:hypothetical protein